MPTTRLLYVTDPMCSWCYGFAPTLAAIEAELAEGIEVALVLGGLAPDSDEPMDPAMQRYVQQAWHAVSERTGVEFNHDFWTRCAPRRSTWPACRAVLVAGELGGADIGRAMLAAIQRAYYREAQNPSDDSTLIELAGELGLDRQAFAAGLGSQATQARLLADFDLRDRLGASSYPSLALERDGRGQLLFQGCLDLASVRALLASEQLLA